MPLGFSGLKGIELALTDKRLLGKTSGTTINLTHKQIEMGLVRRSLLGLLFNYGTITLSGKGVSKVKFKGVIGPKAVMNAIDAAAETAIFGSYLPKDDSPVAAAKKYVPPIESPHAPTVKKEVAPTPPEPIAPAQPNIIQAAYKDPNAW